MLMESYVYGLRHRKTSDVSGLVSFTWKRKEEPERSRKRRRRRQTSNWSEGKLLYKILIY